MIAEDDALSRISLQRILSNWGHDVLTAEDGLQAWEAMRRDDPPMLAILDWMMPGMDGLEVCRRVRALHQENPPYIIILSGKSHKEDIVQGLNDGANDYLTKPVNFGELHARIGVGKRMLELQTALFQKNREIWESRQRLERTFAALDDAIFVIDARSLRIVDCNPSACAIFGYARAELLGRTTAFLHVDRPTFQEFLARLRPAMKEKGAFFLPEFQMKRRDGTVFPTENGVSALMDEHGRRVGWVNLVRDVSRRKEAETREKLHQEKLAQAAKMSALGTLVAGVAHEVNNPNNFIILNTPLLEEVWADALPVLEAHHCDHPEFKLAGIDFLQMRDNVPRLFSGIHEGSKRIKRIVSELKGFARQAPLDMRSKVQMNQVVEAALTLLRKTVAQHTNHFEMQLAPDLPLVQGDFQKLEQVVVNVLINACQALPDKGRGIVVCSFHERAEQTVVLRIEDQGNGIAPEHMGRICDPFFSTKHALGGTGLGLAISSSIIQDHGGRMAFDSTPGLGTTVTIHLQAVH